MDLKAKFKSYKKNGNMFAIILLIYPILMFLIFGIYAQIKSILLTFQEMDFLGNTKFLPWNNIFGNYKEFIRQAFDGTGLVGISIINSLKNWFICTMISNPLYIIFSYFLYKKSFGHKFVAVVVMLPEIISGLIYCLVFKQIINGPLIEIMNLLGYENFPNLLDAGKYTFFIVIFYRIWCSFGASCIFYSNAMSAIDPSIIESSKIDGIDNMFQELWYIILPLIFPTFKTLFVMGLASIFVTDSGLVTFYMYGAPPEVYNLAYYNTVRIFNVSSSSGYPILAAEGILLTLICLPTTLGIRKFLDKIDPNE